MPTTRIRRAIHEAAHAVVALALGGDVERIDIIRRPERGRSGECTHRTPPQVWTLMRGGQAVDERETPGLRVAAVAAAGVLALDDTASTAADFLRLGGVTDFRRTTPEGIALARLLVRKYRAQIERLAEALAAAPTGEMDAAAIRAVLGI